MCCSISNEMRRHSPPPAGLLGCNAKGLPIAAADEIPLEFGAMLWRNNAFEVLRPAPRHETTLPFATWMTLARATPAQLPLDEAQALLGDEGQLP
ncbi:MAG: hypothetical protein H7332_11770 [Bdellovibrionales bacterium]|nr:hypothetical protein [Ramlibacter sp.]